MENHTPIEYSAQMAELIPLFRERLDAGQKVRFSPRGVSMLPMIRQGIDSVELSLLPEKLKKYDLPLYQRDNGQYVLHRVVGVGENYTCIGDNQFALEQGVRHDQMIALVTAFYRGEHRFSCDCVSYRLYCFLWHRSRPLRHFYRRCIGWLRRHL